MRTLLAIFVEQDLTGFQNLLGLSKLLNNI